MLRFRVLNLLACVVLTGFNAALGIWPMVAMNVVLCAINLWHIQRLASSRHDEAAYDVLEVGPDDEYLRHVLRLRGSDIVRFQPDLVWDGAAPGARRTSCSAVTRPSVWSSSATTATGWHGCSSTT